MIDIESIAKLSLNPGDMLVCRVRDKLTAQQAATLSEQLKRVLMLAGHVNATVVILDNGMQFDVLAAPPQVAAA